MVNRESIIARRVEQHCRKLIEKGIGDGTPRLPSMLHIARRLGVSTSSVSRALHRLQGQGLVRVMPKSGVSILGVARRLDSAVARDPFLRAITELRRMHAFGDDGTRSAPFPPAKALTPDSASGVPRSAK